MMSTKLEQAIEAIKAGNKQQGRELLAEVLKEDRGNEQAWLWLTQTDISHEQKIKSLQQVLRIDPDNESARRGLAKLQEGQSTSTPKKKKRKSIVSLALFSFVSVALVCACLVFYSSSIPNQQEASSGAIEPFYVWVDGFENCPTHSEFGKQVTDRANTYKADGNARFIYIPHGTRIEVLDKPDEYFYKIRWDGEITYIQILMTQPQDPAQGVIPKSEDCL